MLTNQKSLLTLANIVMFLFGLFVILIFFSVSTLQSEANLGVMQKSYQNKNLNITLISNTNQCLGTCEAEIEICNVGNKKLLLNDKVMDVWFLNDKGMKIADLSEDIIREKSKKFKPIKANKHLIEYQILKRENITYFVDVPDYGECLRNSTCDKSWILKNNTYYCERYDKVSNNTWNEARKCLKLYSINNINDTCEYKYKCRIGLHQEKRWGHEYFNYNPKAQAKFLNPNECWRLKLRGYKKPTLGENNIDWKIKILDLEPKWAWWNSSWSYRRNYTFTEQTGSDLTGYVANITVDTESLISAGKMKSDCTDVRFVNSTGNEMPYWFEPSTCNTSSTQFWVRFESLGANAEETISMYYGNPSATDESDGSSTFDFFEDFESYDVGDLSGQGGWSKSGTGTISVLDNGHTNLHSSECYSGSKCAASTNAQSGYGLNYDKTFSTLSSNSILMFFGWTDTSDGQLVLYTGADSSNQVGYLKFRYGNFYIRSGASEVNLQTHEFENWYRVQWYINLSSEKHDVRLDETLHDNNGAHYDFRHSPSELSWIRLYTSDQIQVIWDAISIRKWIDPEPTVIAGSEESGDTMPPLWKSQTTNDTDNIIRQGDSIVLASEGYDETALDWAWLATNETGVWENKSTYGSPMNMNDVSATWSWSNFTWQNNSVPKGTTIGWRIYYNDTSGNENATDIGTFEIKPVIKVKQWASVEDYTGTWIVYNLTIWVYNNHTSPVTNILVHGDQDFSGDYWINTSLAAGESNTTVWIHNYTRTSSDETIVIDALKLNYTVGGAGGSTDALILINPIDPVYKVDTSPPTYSLNSTNSTTPGTPVSHNLKWTDETGLSGYIFSFDNCTGSFINDTWVSMTGTENWSNVTKTINATVGCTIRWCVYANDTSNNWNGTSCENPFSYVTTQPNVPQYFLNSTNSTIAGEPIEMRLKWTDVEGLSGYIFSFDNGTGALLNDTWVPMTGTENWSNVTKIVNSTVGTTIRWKVYANDTDNNWNASLTYSFTTSSWIEIIPSQAWLDGLMFDDVSASSTENPARNDTTGPGGGTEYNFTVGSATTVNVDFYHKLNETFSNMWVNESASVTNATHGFSTNTEVNETWTIVGDSTTNCTNLGVGDNCWVRYYLDVDEVATGTYEKNYEICGVYAGGSCN